jgi:putative ABC transport system permease protein
MFKNFLTVAFRDLVTQKLYSTINILGLAVGLASFILIALFVQHELSYDDYHSNANRVYRISRDYSPGDRVIPIAGEAPVLAALLALNFPQVEKVARIARCGGGTLVSNGDLRFREENLAAADGDIFDILDFQWRQGDPRSALATPNSIVLTESAARKYFGSQNPMGEMVVVENDQAVMVNGVIGDLPDNSHLRFDMLVSMGYLQARSEAFMQNWNALCFHTYVLLRQGADIAEIQSQSAELFERHLGQGSSRTNDFTAVALPNIHLGPARGADMSPPGSMTSVYAFSSIAAFILSIACINFMNLATARATQRAKEIGVRKVVGASRTSLIAQFLGESLLLTSIAAIVALSVVELTLPAFSSFVQKDLRLDYVSVGSTLPLLMLLTLIVGLAAGSYPAFYLSAFKPARVLKGDLTRDTGAATFRKALVVIQFSIAIGLVIATAIVYQQMVFMRNIELGYNTERIVVVRGSLSGGLGTQWPALKREWLGHPEVTHVTASDLTPGRGLENRAFVRPEGGNTGGEELAFVVVDYGFFQAYGIDFLAGRTFSQDFGSDRIDADRTSSGTVAGVIVSALAARQFGWTPQNAIGKTFELTDRGINGRIVGVVTDTYFESLHDPIEPIMYALASSGISQASIKISGRNMRSTLEQIDATWREFMPDQPVTRRFLEEDFEALYQTEERQGHMLSYFSLLAVFIACLGLFGIASYTAERKTKEIGIRKVLGGTVWDIVGLFGREFSKLVLLANTVAWPIAFFMMQRWLTSFAYRSDINLLVFIACSFLVLLVALLTVGIVSARAALMNPIRSLRYE